MMKYILFDSKNCKQDFQYVVIATSFENPLRVYRDIEKELIPFQYEGFILFDMLTYSGDNSERFFKIYYSNKQLDFTTMEYISFSKNSKHRKRTLEVLKEENCDLDNTVLNYVQKNLMSNDLVV